MIVGAGNRYNHEKTWYHQMLQKASFIVLVFDLTFDRISLIKVLYSENACIKSYWQSFSTMSLLGVCRNLSFEYPKNPKV